jgi:hypothetical protein
MLELRSDDFSSREFIEYFKSTLASGATALGIVQHPDLAVAGEVAFILRLKSMPVVSQSR